MKNFYRIIAFIFILSITSVGYSINNITNYVCPTTFAYVATDYTIEQVIAICGLPTHRVTSKQQPPGPHFMQEWIYNKNPYLSNRPVVSLSNLTAGTHQVVVVLYNQKVVGISVNGQVVQNTNYCNNITIRQGDAAQQVIGACGVAQRTLLIPANVTPIEVTQLIYQRPNDMPSTTFVFENGKLVNKVN